MTAPLNAIESPSVLANRGVPVVVHKVDAQMADEGQETQYVKTVDEVSHEYSMEHKFVHLSALTIANIEENYESLELWQQILEKRPHATVIRALAFAWKEPTEKVGERLIEGRIDQYALALQIAAYRAQGVPVDDLGKLLKRGLQETEAARELLRGAVGVMVSTDVASQDQIGEAVSQLQDLVDKAQGRIQNDSSENEQLPSNEPEPSDSSPASIPGTSGSRHGSKRVAASTSSGRSRPRKSTSRSKRT